MVAGPDWVEISLPESMKLGGAMSLHFSPSRHEYRVSAKWQHEDRVGLLFVNEGPREEQFSGVLWDPRPASIKKLEHSEMDRNC